MTLLILLSKLLAFVLMCLLTAFVMTCGKNNTGVKVPYAFTSAMLWVVMLA